MATSKDLHENLLVTTQFGLAVITLVDNDTKSVRVKHLSANTPITDFRYKDIQICGNIRIIPNTKSKYLDLNGKSLSVKEYSPSKTLKRGRVTCAVYHPELLKVVDVDFSEEEVKFITKRESGFYWVKPEYKHEWEIAEYSTITQYFYYTQASRTLEDSVFLIDENKITRKV